MPFQQNSGQNQNIKVAHKISENVAEFQHLGITLTNQNFMLEEIGSRLNPSNACCDLVQNFFSRQLSKSTKINMYRTINLPFVWVWNVVSHIKVRT